MGEPVLIGALRMRTWGHRQGGVRRGRGQGQGQGRGRAGPRPAGGPSCRVAQHGTAWHSALNTPAARLLAPQRLQPRRQRGRPRQRVLLQQPLQALRLALQLAEAVVLHTGEGARVARGAQSLQGRVERRCRLRRAAWCRGARGGERLGVFCPQSAGNLSECLRPSHAGVAPCAQTQQLHSKQSSPNAPAMQLLLQFKICRCFLLRGEQCATLPAAHWRALRSPTLPAAPHWGALCCPTLPAAPH